MKTNHQKIKETYNITPQDLTPELYLGAPPGLSKIINPKINKYKDYPRRPIMDKLGLDIGTKNIVLSVREQGGRIRTIHEVNGYITIRKDDQFTENLLKKQNIPFFPYGDELIAIGTKAENLAYMFNKTLQRPMAEGALSREDESAQEIMAIIIKSIITTSIGKDIKPNTILYYCTTAKSLNDTKLNIDFHKKIIKIMIEKYIGKDKIKSHHINEGRCLILSQLKPETDTGAAIGISWGAGTITIHAGYAGIPIFEFSLVGAGDKIDQDAAIRFGYDPQKPNGNYKETPTTISKIKQEMDLTQDHENRIEQTIKIMYEILIENVVTGIINGFKENRDKIRFPHPVPIINGGGTAMPKGFIDLLTKEFQRHTDISVPIGDITLVPDPLYAVSKGALIAAEAHST